MMGHYLWGLNFFVFSPKNIGQIREAVFYLVKWGFNYETLMQVPMDEFMDYIQLLADYNERKKNAMEDTEE